MKTKKILIYGCLVGTIMLCSCSKKTIADSKSASENSVASNTTAKAAGESQENTESIYYKDATALIDTLEETHPAFALDAVPTTYNAAKEEYLKAAKESELSQNDFLMLTRKFMTSLGDGHTYPYSEEPYNYADINGVAIGDDLWLMDLNTYEKQGKIIQIGNVKTADLFQLIDLYFPAENEAARDRAHRNGIEQQPVLEYAGCQFDNRGIDIVVEKEGITSTVNIPWKNTADFMKEASKEKPVNMESKLIDDDILYVDWNSCMLEDTEFESNVNTLRKALNDGITKVIIDMRDNGGGNAWYCREYLKQLGMQGPEYSVVFRHSPLSAKQRGESKTSGIDKETGDLSCVHNETIQLVVLINEKTFSAATMLAVYVQDGKLGTVIGRMSSNSPTCYSDVVTYEMKNSGLKTQMSTSYLTRPDPQANQKALDPDIVTELGEDSLVAAKEYLK